MIPNQSSTRRPRSSGRNIIALALSVLVFTIVFPLVNGAIRGWGSGKPQNRQMTKSTFPSSLYSQPIPMIDSKPTLDPDQDPVAALRSMKVRILTNKSGEAIIVDCTLASRWFTDQEAILFLSKLKKARAIYLAGTAVTDKGIQALQAMDHLEELTIDTTRITDASLPTLAEMKALEELWLTNTRMTDKAAATFRTMSSLKKLVLHETRMTYRTVQGLRRKMPQTIIWF